MWIGSGNTPRLLTCSNAAEHYFLVVLRYSFCIVGSPLFVTIVTIAVACDCMCDELRIHSGITIDRLSACDSGKRSSILRFRTVGRVFIRRS